MIASLKHRINIPLGLLDWGIALRCYPLYDVVSVDDVGYCFLTCLLHLAWDFETIFAKYQVGTFCVNMVV